MSYEADFTEKLAFQGISTSKTNEVEAGGHIGVNEPIANATTNGEVAFTLDVSQLKGIYIVSDQDILLETNDGSSPDDTISLKAGIPYLWHENSYHACLFDADITALFVTNTSGSTANLKIDAFFDPTV